MPAGRDERSLASRWPLSGRDDLRDALLAAYSAPGRGYHDQRHLAEVLDRLDELAAAGEPFDALPVRLAAWFHDGVYDGRAEAEERSARWALEALTGLPVEVVEEVARLVRLTERHRAAPADDNGAALCDADLAILAAPPGRYADYVAGVRREYAHVPDEDFRRGRAAVLIDLADSPTLFATAHGRRHWEPDARRNLRGELDGLRGSRES